MDASNQLGAFVKETVSLIESLSLFSAYEQSGFFETQCNLRMPFDIAIEKMSRAPP